MKIFLAGTTGALGRHLIPQLVAKGYPVFGMTRSREKVGALRSAGGEPVVADGLDREAVLRAVTGSKPEKRGCGPKLELACPPGRASLIFR